jgi:hypothetical protein
VRVDPGASFGPFQSVSPNGAFVSNPLRGTLTKQGNYDIVFHYSTDAKADHTWKGVSPMNPFAKEIYDKLARVPRVDLECRTTIHVAGEQ